jgi:hypothetical protein
MINPKEPRRGEMIIDEMIVITTKREKAPSLQGGLFHLSN